MTYGLRKVLSLLAMLALPLALAANVPSKPYTFVANTPALSGQVNTNFDTLYTWANGNVDHTNVSSTTGIYASQIIPDASATASFGGGNSAYGYTFSLATPGATPLTVLGYSGQTADLLGIFSTGRTTKYVWVDSGGVLRTSGAPAFGGIPSWTGALPTAQGGTSQTAWTGSTCVRAASTTQLASAPGDCVDTVSTQTIGGVKTFSSAPVMSGASISSGTIGQAQVANGYCDTATTQTCGGAKTFNAPLTVAGSATMQPTITVSNPSGTYGPTAPFWQGIYAGHDVIDTYLEGNGDVHLRASGFYGGGFVFETNGANARLTIANGGAATFTGAVSGASFAAGSSTYGPTNAVVNGDAKAVHFTDGGTVYTGYTAATAPIMVGTLNATGAIVNYGTTASATNPAFLGSGGDAVSGVVGTLLEGGVRGSAAYYTIDGSGNVGAAGQMYATNFNLAASRPAWKTNVAPIPDALGMLRKMPSLEWCYNDKGPVHESCAPGEHRHFGPMSRPVDGIVATRAMADDPKHGVRKGEVVGINETNLLGLDVAAVQQLADKVDRLQKRLAHLERRR